MSDVRVVRKGRDDVVAPPRGFLRNAPRLTAERRKEENPTLVERRATLLRDPHGVDRARRADDDRLFAPQKYAQAFSFNRRVKTAGDGHALVAHTPRGIARAQDCVARRSGGEEERRPGGARAALDSARGQV